MNTNSIYQLIKTVLPVSLLIVLLVSCSSTGTDSVEGEPTLTQETVYEELQFGDIIFHTSQSDQSEAIQLVTNSVYSHMGLIYIIEGDYYVYEAVQPVKLTPLDDWIDRGKDGKYVVKRLKNDNGLQMEMGIEQMKSAGEKYLDKNYDMRFEWSDDKIYCSELVWKIYKEAFNIEIGQLQKFSDFDLSNESVQEIIELRFPEGLPMDEFVISPDQMFNAENLETVVSK